MAMAGSSWLGFLVAVHCMHKRRKTGSLEVESKEKCGASTARLANAGRWMSEDMLRNSMRDAY